MTLNHRYALRLSTDFALWLFIAFAFGGALWVADEFLNWNLLPDWIDRYAQLIVVLFGIAGGLAVGTSVLCSVVLVAEAAAQHVGLPDFRTSNRTWRIAAVVSASGLILFVIFYRVDAYRKLKAQEQFRIERLADYNQQVTDLQTAVVRVGSLFPQPLLASFDSGSVLESPAGLVRFLGAVRNSTPHRPSVSLVIRAQPPYQFCRLDVTERSDRVGEASQEPFAIRKQFYIGFPTAEENLHLERLFLGQIAPITNRLEGEVLDTVRPSAWHPLTLNGKTVGLVVLKTDYRMLDFRHSGPSGNP